MVVFMSNKAVSFASDIEVIEQQINQLGQVPVFFLLSFLSPAGTVTAKVITMI